MEKAGLIEEIVSETLDTTLGEEDVETEVEAEVEKIMVELTQDVVQLPAAKRPTVNNARFERILCVLGGTCSTRDGRNIFRFGRREFTKPIGRDWQLV